MEGWGWHMLWNFNMFSHLTPPASRQPSTWTPRWTRPSGRKKHIFRRKVHGFKGGRNMCPWNKFQKQPCKLLRLARRNMWWKKHYLKYVSCRYARNLYTLGRSNFVRIQNTCKFLSTYYVLRLNRCKGSCLQGSCWCCLEIHRLTGDSSAEYSWILAQPLSHGQSSNPLI